jgi:hypothetical protein
VTQAVDQLVSRNRQQPAQRLARKLTGLVAHRRQRTGKGLGQQIGRDLPVRCARAQVGHHDATVAAEEEAERFAVARSTRRQQLHI